jgi:PAS domain S-box-containing protein
MTNQMGLIEYVSDAVISTDSAFVIRTWNRAAEALYGWKAEEVIGRRLVEVVPTTYLDGDGKAVIAAFRDKGLWRGEVIQYHRDGTPIDILSSVSLTFDHDGRPNGAIGVNRDIRDRKRAERDLEQANQRLTILRQIDLDIIKARSPEDITETVLRHIRDLIPCLGANLNLINEEMTITQIFRFNMDAPGMPPIEMQVPFVHTPITVRLAAGETVIIGDLQAELGSWQGTVTDLMRQAIALGLRATLSAPLLIQGKLRGYLNLVSTLPNAFTPAHADIVSEIANQLAIAFQSAWLLEAVQVTNQQLQAFSAQMVKALEDERRHIARELHDEVGQTLTALGLMLDMEQRHSQANHGLPDLGEARALISDLTKRIRDMSLDLRPSMLDDLGLVAALVWHFTRYEQQSQITVDFRHSGITQRFSPAIESTLYRIIQEALTNIARYAKVDRAYVRLWATPDALHVQVEDEGVGFDPEAALLANATSGLLGLRERALMVGGTCKIESSLGAGTVIDVSVPLH